MEIEILKKRLRIFRKLIKREQAAIDRLKHKSRSVRHSNPHSPRKNWYTDRMQELALLISFKEGKMTEEEYVHSGLDDKFGQIMTFIGNTVIEK